MKPWFEYGECEKLEIRQLKTGKRGKPTASLVMEDRKAIARLRQRIEKMSPDGDMMKSMLVDEEIQLIFTCKGGATQIEVYDGRFKTPTTGFNSDPKERALEKTLHADFKNLLAPEIGQRTLLAEGLEISFDRFSIRYQGSKTREQQPGEPTIGPITTDTYLLKVPSAPEQSLKAVSGQNAPQPVPFEVKGKKFELLTFMDPMEERLDPDYFMVVPQRK